MGSNRWKSLLGKSTLFLVDFLIVYLSILLFSIHFSILFFIPYLPDINYHLPPLIFCLLVVMAYKAMAGLANKKRWKQFRIFEACFFGVFTLLGGAACLLTSWLIFFHIAYPKILVLCVLTGAICISLFFARGLTWRRPAIFISIILMFNFFFLRVSRYTIAEADLLPISSPGVRVVQQIAIPDEGPDRSKPIGPENFVLNILKSFAGLLLATHQYGYVSLDESETFLYICDFNIRTDTTSISKVRLDDFQVVARLEGDGYFRDMLVDKDSQQLIATNFNQREVCYYRDSDLTRINCLDMGVPSVLNLVKLPDGRLIVTSEHGWIVVIPPEQQGMEKLRPPVFCEEMSLDKSGTSLYIASLAGYTISVFDLESLQLSRKRIASIASCGIALDLENRQIFLPRLMLGDLLCLDSNSLDTIARVPLHPGLRSVCYLATRNIIVAANYFNGNLYFIDRDTFHLMHTFWAGTKIRSLKFSSVRNRLYIQTARRILEMDIDAFLGSIPVDTE